MMLRLLRIVGASVAVVPGLVIPVLVATSIAPASADTVVDGCTIVANPTPTTFTNCPNANLSQASLTGLNLSYANFVGSTFASCSDPGTPQASCSAIDLADANLTQANLSRVTLVAFSGVLEQGMLTDINTAGTDFEDANLSGADLAGDTLTDNFIFGEVAVTMTDATLTGANFTGTSLVPPNQTVTATGQVGAVATWSTPAGISGATPGSCTPPSGSTFPLFTTTVTCQVLDDSGDVATGTFEVTVEPTTSYFSRVLIPSNGAAVSGEPVLDAEASDGPGATQVLFELSGGTLSNHVIATGTSTIFGWLARWNSTTVANGTYSLVAFATDADGNTDTSTAVSLTVDNPAPSTSVLIPSAGASVSGGSSLLDATASSYVSSVTYELSGGTLSNHVIATGTATIYGWLAQWNTASVPNGTYSLESVAAYPNGVNAKSAPVSVTVDN